MASQPTQSLPTSSGSRNSISVAFSKISTPLAIPGPSQQFYYDPSTLRNRIIQLEERVQQLSGHVKMMEVELHEMEGQANDES